MQILFVGGTGLLSGAASVAVLEAGHELFLLNPNLGEANFSKAHRPARVLRADAHIESEVRAATAGLDFDVVVQWIGYQPDLIAQDLRVFRGIGQYVFISTTAVYEKPPSTWFVSERTPITNRSWGYATAKAACEELLMAAYAEQGFPATVIRPALTYGATQIPVPVGSWEKPYTIVDRMRRGAPVIIPGDGTAIFTITHNSDFARGLLALLGRADAIGEDFHITSDEALSWNQVYDLIAKAAGVSPSVVHVPTAGIVASSPELRGGLWGNLSWSAVFDNSKLRRLAPDFKALVPLSEGIRRTIAWFDADAQRREIDWLANRRWDALAAVYRAALAAARDAGAGL
jgi:nucleoside-diphosphate-sugar epimerase